MIDFAKRNNIVGWMQFQRKGTFRCMIGGIYSNRYKLQLFKKYLLKPICSKKITNFFFRVRDLTFMPKDLPQHFKIKSRLIMEFSEEDIKKFNNAKLYKQKQRNKYKGKLDDKKDPNTPRQL